jgi:FeS assembly SUF system protein
MDGPHFPGYAMPDHMSEPLAGEPFVARAGAKRTDATPPKFDEDTVIEALRTVYDPEIPVNIYDLGLIYDLEIASDGDVTIRMTLTAPGCPVAGTMPGMVADAVAGVEDVGEVEVTLVWTPPWTPDRMSDDAKLALDMGY